MSGYPNYPIPNNEKRRLEALDTFQILGTLEDAAFDRITQMCSRLFGCEISLVSLIDKNRQWFKSHTGLACRETPRDQAFCNHVVCDPDSVFVVNDASKDPRFCSNPLVTSDPNIRFYAGAPLVVNRSSGIVVGSLCVISDKPKTFSDSEQAELLTLANVVVDVMRLHVETIQRQQRLKKRMVVSLGHEIRNPLHGIQHHLESISSEERDEITKHHATEAIGLLAKVVEIVGDMSLHDQEAVLRAENNLSRVCISDLIRDLIKCSASLNPDIDYTMQTVSSDNDNSEGIFAYTDRGKTKLLFENLAILAGKTLANRPGKVIFKISVDGEFIKVQVIFPSKPRLVALESAEGEKFGCSELHMCNLLATKLSLPLEHSPPEEETFIVKTMFMRMIDEDLNVLKASKLQNKRLVDEQGSTCCVKKQKGDLVVLCVEDEPLNRAIMRRFLKVCGLRNENVLMFEDGDEVDTDKLSQPDICFLDIVMRRENGDTLCSRLVKTGWKCPIVATTGNAEEFERLHEVGFCRVIAKPFSSNDLDKAMNDFIKNLVSEPYKKQKV
mmetsp:Transcript_1655/g.2520  ORF Transcript_1655/g.2520 Transcript_1655/m.2520 type:complete len:555 (-) Transcript_1655:1478-3142(-)